MIYKNGTVSVEFILNAHTFIVRKMFLIRLLSRNGVSFILVALAVSVDFVVLSVKGIPVTKYIHTLH